MKAKTVDEYIRGLEDWQKELVAELRGLVREAAPAATESIKWAQPVYGDNGPFCYIRAFKKHVNFGFWRGVELPDEAGILQGSGDKMRHVKLTAMEDIQREPFQALVREAVELNRRKGDPTKGT
jgi:hypothetical protein